MDTEFVKLLNFRVASMNDHDIISKLVLTSRNPESDKRHRDLARVCIVFFMLRGIGSSMVKLGALWSAFCS